MKDILVLCDSNDSNQHRVETALAYARQFGSHLTGMHMIPFPVIPVYGGMYPDAPSYSAAFQIDKANERAKELEESFKEAASEAGIEHDKYRPTTTYPAGFKKSI